MYYFAHEDVFAQSYISGYLIQVTLYVHQKSLCKQSWSQNIPLHVRPLHSTSQASTQFYDSTSKKKLCQPITRDIYTAPCQHAAHNIIFFYKILWVYIWSFFCASLSPTQENIVWDKNVTVFTDTPTIASHLIVHFKIQFNHTFKSKIFSFYLFRVRVWFTAPSDTHPQ